MPKPIQRKRPVSKPVKTQPNRHDLPAWVREEEQRVQATCFRCHKPKPFGQGWLCPKCKTIDQAASARADVTWGRNK